MRRRTDASQFQPGADLLILIPTRLVQVRPHPSSPQVQLDEATVKGLEQQLAGLRKETDALNRERKLQQHAAGGAGWGLRVRPDMPQ